MMATTTRDPVICTRFWADDLCNLLAQVSCDVTDNGAKIWDINIDYDWENEQWYGRLYRHDIERELADANP